MHRLTLIPGRGGGGTGDVDVGTAPTQIPNNTIVQNTVNQTISNLLNVEGDTSLVTEGDVNVIINEEISSVETTLTEHNTSISNLQQDITNIINNPPTGRQKGTATTTESLEEGMYVYVYRDGNTKKCCRASAATGQLANGYVLTAAAVSAEVTYYTNGENDKANDLGAGKVYLSAATPGRGTLTPPLEGSGHWLQEIGFSVGLNCHQFELGLTIHLL